MKIQSIEVIETLLRNKGVYPGDPPMSLVYWYIDDRGQVSFAVFMHKWEDDMRLSPYVVRHSLLMQDGVLTQAGADLLQNIDCP